ncbi:helix-turn-helix transcriptional regulator [Catenulispora yoronensis]|uniref:Helix-turn-helix transcriptional regulator n=1 Tax=Catenulispora yoronensis TaxID=450799 RepID=A0ABN2TSP8_9ACTN
MTPSPSSSAQAARKALAGRLREVMRDARLNGRQLADQAGWSTAKVSRILNAISPVSEDDVRTWCRVCRAEEATGDLLAELRTAEQAYVTWKRLHRTGLSKVYETSTPLFQRTRHFRVYSPHVVPGLLQTAEYAEAVLAMIAEFQGTPADDITEAVAKRLQRSRVIREGDHRFGILIEEQVLRHRIGDTAAMTAQLGYLLEVISLPSLVLGVIPFGTPRAGMWPIESFYVYDDTMATQETLTASITITAPSEVASFVKAHKALSDQAVYGKAAVHRITAAVEAL